MIKNDTIHISNLHCADCVSKIEKRMRTTKGIHDLHLSFTTGQLNITYDPTQVTLNELQKRVEGMGYDIFKFEMTETKLISVYNPRFLLPVLSGTLLFIGLIVMFLNIDIRSQILNYNILASEILFFSAMVFGGYFVLKNAVQEMLEKEISMEFLMIVAAVGALLIGALPEAAAILFLFSIAELLESYATSRNRRSINELIGLAPKTVNLKKGNKTVKILIENIKPGDIVVVRSGQYIGVDGTVVKGRSSVNQASITGEPLPVKKEAGDVVYAGTLNHDGRLEIRVSKLARDTTLAKIIKLIENADDSKSKTERFMDRFAKYYTPSILLLAFLVVIIPTFVFDQPFNTWFYKALLLILISCPCAIAISTPVSMVSAITNGAKNGVLFKGGVYVEGVANIDTVAFDKTGTLTAGRPVVSKVIPLNGHSRSEILQIAASLECLSKHPLGEAIVECAEQEGSYDNCVEKFKTVLGKGVYGTIDGTTYYVGDDSMFNDSALKTLNKQFKPSKTKINTIVLVGTKSKIIGLVVLEDKLRENSRSMVKALRKTGVKRVVMLTGDNERTARYIANQLDIEEYHSQLLPNEKVKIIRQLNQESRSSKQKVAMIGDGINDAPAMAAADLGIAMGAAGSDTALETADIALMKDDISKIPYMIQLGRKTMAVVKQNIALAIGIKLLFVILVFPGFVTLWMAVAIGDMGVSLGVILNALRLGRV